MMFLLITTSWQNPGDIFVMMGVKRMILEACPDAKFIITDKENADSWPEITDPSIDKIVWCGMPLFWSFPTHHSRDIFWWEGLLRPIMSYRKKDFAILGAGTAGRISEDPKRAFTRPDEIRGSFAECELGSSLLTLRDDCIKKLIPDSGNAEVLPCPALFAAGPDSGCVPHEATCNIMPFGGHYPELDAVAVERWEKSRDIMAEILRKSDAFFCAHNHAEMDYAKGMGWEKNVCGPEDLLMHLWGSKFHTGNRVHGAIVAGSFGRSICHGYDLRLRCAEICGCEVVSLAEEPYPFEKAPQLDSGLAFQRYVSLIKNWISA